MRYEQLSVGELTVSSTIGGTAAQVMGSKFYLNGAIGSDGNDGKSFAAPVKTLTNAYSLMTSTASDAIILEQSTSSVNLAANKDWKLNNSFLMGNSNARMNHRSRLGMSTAFTPFFTVSGYGNTFANLYFMHGTGTADLVGLYITGNRNTFVNCHIGTPLFAALGDQAGYAGVSIAATETYFKDCVIGSNTISRTGAYGTVSIAPPSTHFGYTRFENCTFLAMAGGANPTHIYVDNSATALDETYVECINCRFVTTSTNMATAMTYSFSFAATAAAGDTCAVMLDPTCQFINCGLTTVNNYSNLWIPTAAKTAAGVTSALMATVE
jgi:hypothetical protein